MVTKLKSLRHTPLRGLNPSIKSLSGLLTTKFRERTVVRDLAFRLIVALSATFVFAGLLLFVMQTKNDSRELRTRLKADTKQLGNLLTLPLWTFNETEIKSLVSTHAMAEDITGIVIVDDREHLVTNFQKNNHSRDLQVKRDIVYKGQKVGYLRVFASTTPLFTRALKNLAMTVALSVMAIVIVVLLIFFLLNIYLDQPLQRLTSGIQLIATGHYRAKLPSVPQKELARITDEVNFMADKIALRELQIRDSMEVATILRTELGIAETIQRSMTSTKGFSTTKRVAQHYQPMKNLSGDWMTVFECDRGNTIYALVGDVTGHGIPQGLVTMAAFGAIQTLRPLIQQNSRSFTPAAILNILRIALVTLLYECQLAMTVSVIKIDTGSRDLTMSSAGHPLPLVLRPESSGVKVQALTAKAQSPLGFEFLTRSAAPPAYKDSHHKLETEDIVLLFSDGLTEARDRNNKQFQKSFLTTLKSLDPRQAPSVLLDRILQNLRTHTDGKQSDDDICLLVIDTRKDDGHEAVA